MPFSLNLPFVACDPLTRLARRLRRPARREEREDDDQAAYFEHQYLDTVARYNLHMTGLELSGKTVLDVGSGLGGRALGWLELGAGRVINVDINRQDLAAGRAILDERYAVRKADRLSPPRRNDRCRTRRRSDLVRLLRAPRRSGLRLTPGARLVTARQSLLDRPGEPLNMLSPRLIRRIIKESPFELLHSYYTALLIKRA